MHKLLRFNFKVPNLLSKFCSQENDYILTATSLQILIALKVGAISLEGCFNVQHRMESSIQMGIKKGQKLNGMLELQAIGEITTN